MNDISTFKLFRYTCPKGCWISTQYERIGWKRRDFCFCGFAFNIELYIFQTKQWKEIIKTDC